MLVEFWWLSSVSESCRGRRRREVEDPVEKNKIVKGKNNIKEKREKKVK